MISSRTHASKYLSGRTFERSMTVTDFPTKKRLRFRKLLEVAHSTGYNGEREAALGAAARMAAAHGMTLREAVGMKNLSNEEKPATQTKRPRGFRADFGAAGPESMGSWWAPREKNTRGERHLDNDSVAADKKRRQEALEDAIQRGLDIEEIAAAERKKARRKGCIHALTDVARGGPVPNLSVFS